MWEAPFVPSMAVMLSVARFSDHCTLCEAILEVAWRVDGELCVLDLSLFGYLTAISAVAMDNVLYCKCVTNRLSDRLPGCVVASQSAWWFYIHVCGLTRRSLVFLPRPSGCSTTNVRQNAFMSVFRTYYKISPRTLHVVTFAWTLCRHL